MDGSMEKSCREHCGFRLTSPQGAPIHHEKALLQGQRCVLGAKVDRKRTESLHFGGVGRRLETDFATGALPQHSFTKSRLSLLSLMNSPG